MHSKKIGFIILTYKNIDDTVECIESIIRINSDDFLKIGMTTENSIIVNQKEDAFYLPTSALKRDRKGDYVFVADGNSVEKVYVKTGISDDINTEIMYCQYYFLNLH